MRRLSVGGELSGTLKTRRLLKASSSTSLLYFQRSKYLNSALILACLSARFALQRPVAPNHTSLMHCLMLHTRKKKCLKLNWALQIRRPCRCHLHWRLCCSSKSLWSGSMQQSGVTACSYKTAVMLMFFTMLAWALCLFKFLTEILIYHTFILYFSTVSAPVDFFFPETNLD